MPTKTAAVFTSSSDSAIAGRELGRQMRAAIGERPDAVIVFASARFDHVILLQAIAETCEPGTMVGASSAGEFTGTKAGVGSACALAIRSQTMRFTAGIATNVGADRAAAAREVVSRFRGTASSEPHRAALVLTDALAGHADDLLEELTLATAAGYDFVGGGAGDDARFQRTHVFCGTHVYTDAVVALEILSHKPIGIGVQHGWLPESEAYRVTDVDGARIVTLDGYPAAEVFEAYASATGQDFDRSEPLPFFLHNCLGIQTSLGHRLRMPLSVADDGSVLCAAEIPAGATIHIMRTTAACAVEAGASAASTAIRALGGERPSAALFFDGIATRLRLGDAFDFELEAVSTALGAPLVGFHTYGQIARASGQFGGFHNCTAVVLAFPP